MPQTVDRRARGERGEPGSRRLHGLRVGEMPFEPDVLHHVFCLGAAAEHPVRQREQACAHGLETGCLVDSLFRHMLTSRSWCEKARLACLRIVEALAVARILFSLTPEHSAM